MHDADEDEPNESRRDFMALVKGGALALVAGAVGFGTGSVSAQSSPSGDVGTEANPYKIAYADRVRFTPRTSDPSDPADGTLWYNEDP